MYLISYILYIYFTTDSV